MPGGPDVKWSATAGGTGAGKAVILGAAAWGDLGDIEAAAGGPRNQFLTISMQGGAVAVVLVEWKDEERKT